MPGACFTVCSGCHFPGTLQVPGNSHGVGPFEAPMASTEPFGQYWLGSICSYSRVAAADPDPNHEQPLVAPQVSHFSQVPLRTMVKFWHSEHMLPV